MVTKLRMFILYSLFATPTLAQTLGNNLFKNPGAEEGLLWWNHISVVVLQYPPAHEGTYNFQFPFLDPGYLLQHVEVSDYAGKIDSGGLQALMGGWCYTEFSPNDFWIEVRFFDSVGFEISRWKQENITPPALEWAELKFQITLPPQTRSLDVYFRKDINKQPYLLDDLFFRLLLPDSPLPTGTPPSTQPTPVFDPNHPLGDNLLKNPGAEEELIWWNSLSVVVTAYPPSHTGTYSFELPFLEQVSYLLQNIDLSKYADLIDQGLLDALVGGWRYTEYSPNECWIEVRFLDRLGFEISRWKQEHISTPALEWAELKYQLSLPPQTRGVAVYYRKDVNHQAYSLDDLFFRPLLRESSQPTATPPPFSLPTPTNTPPPQPNTSPGVTYHFNESTPAGNHLLIFPPGRPGEYNLGEVFFRPLSIPAGSERFTDGFGLVVSLDAGEGVTLFGPPYVIESDYAFLRVNAWVSDANVSLALGALDADAADTLAGANVNGSIGLNLLQNAARFVNHFASLEAFYKSERRAIVPVIQAVNPNPEGNLSVQFDNLEIYRITTNDFPVPPK
ncbi:MAG: hypothetical protein ACE15F_15850 [bacterium]